LDAAHTDVQTIILCRCPNRDCIEVGGWCASYGVDGCSAFQGEPAQPATTTKRREILRFAQDDDGAAGTGDRMANAKELALRKAGGSRTRPYGTIRTYSYRPTLCDEAGDDGIYSRQMKRSAAITVSAVLVFVGCGLALISSFLMTLGLALMPAQNAGLQISKYAVFSLAIFMVVLVVWGIATGVNLLKLREWARISMIVFSALLLLIALPGLLFMLFMPFPIPPSTANPDITQDAITLMRPLMAVFYGTVAMLAGWWLYFFNKRIVREQFRGAANLASGVPQIPPTGWAPQATAGDPRKRPISITIIAYLALLSAFVSVVPPAMHLPMMFLGFYFTGWKASLIVVGFVTVQVLMAYGLLRLEPWGRSLAIYYFNFAIFNSVISVILPGAQARYDQAEAVVQSAIGVAPSPMKFPLWIGLIGGLPIIAIQLWFLITRKRAFEHRDDSPTWPS
jgi:hypothetical protein